MEQLINTNTNVAEQSMIRYSMAIICQGIEFYKDIKGFSDYMISNYKRLYKKSTNEYFYELTIYKQITLQNDNGNKEQKPIIKFIKDAFQLKFDYIYLDEEFFTIPTLTNYGISNYNRIINYNTGKILKTVKDNDILYATDLKYDNGQICSYPSLQHLWTKVYRTSDCIDINNQMDYMKEKEFFRYIPGFPEYRVSNYGNIKNDIYNTYMTQTLRGSYYNIVLRYNNESYNKKVHQVVILTFKGIPPSNKHTVDHIDRIRTKG